MTLRLNTALLVGALVLVGGCSSAPGCSDAKTVALVLKGFGQRLDQLLREDKVPQHLVDQFRPKLHLALTTITMAATDDKIKKNSCEAVLEVKMPPDAMRVLTDERLSRVTLGKGPSELPFKLSNGAATIDVKYTAQLTDDGKRVVVELKGHSPLADVLSRLALYGAMDPAGKSLSLPPMARACDDPAAKQHLLDVIEKGLAGIAKERHVDQKAFTSFRNTVTIAFDDIKTLEVSPDLSRFDCAATLKATLPEESAKVVRMAKSNDQEIVALARLATALQADKELALLRVVLGTDVPIHGDTLADNIEYTSSVTPDKEHLEMSVKGHLPLLDVIVATAGLAKGTAKAASQ